MRLVYTVIDIGAVRSSFHCCVGVKTCCVGLSLCSVALCPLGGGLKQPVDL